MSDAARLAAELDRRCLAGLAEAASAFAGDDPSPVCRALLVWKRAEGRRSWPWLPGLCWTALEPLGAGFPVDDDDAVTLGRFVVGAETDPERVRAALAVVQRRVSEPAPAASGPDVTVELRRRALEASVDRFWGEFRHVAERLREPVVAGDRARADALVVASRRQLEDTARRVDASATRLVEVLPRSPGPPPPARAAPPPARAAEPPARAAAPPATDALPDPPAGPAPQPGAPLAALPRAPRRAGPPREAPTGAAGATRPREPDPRDVEYRSVREHPLAPVVFLAAVTLVALVWLLAIATGGSG